MTPQCSYRQPWYLPARRSPLPRSYPPPPTQHCHLQQHSKSCLQPRPRSLVGLGPLLEPRARPPSFPTWISPPLSRKVSHLELTSPMMIRVPTYTSTNKSRTHPSAAHTSSENRPQGKGGGLQRQGIPCPPPQRRKETPNQPSCTTFLPNSIPGSRAGFPSLSRF